MCGQAGIYSHNLGAGEVQLFKYLLFLNVFRGRDSTGIIRVNEGGRVSDQRSILPSPNFLSSDQCKIMDLTDTKIKPVAFLGHTRAATKGKVTLNNAHPFRFENKLWGTHNGTIRKYFKGTSKFETDSEALYALIADEGIDGALQEVDAYDSAYALQFVTREGDDLFINWITNHDRPLHFTYAYGTNTLVWSSTALDLEYAMKQWKLKFGGRTNNDPPIFTLKKNELMRLRVGDNAAEVSFREIKIEKKTYSSVQTYRSTSSTNYGGSSSTSSIIPENTRPGRWVEVKPGVSRFLAWDTSTPSTAALPKPNPASTNSKTETTTSTNNGASGERKPDLRVIEGSKDSKGYKQYGKKYTRDGLSALAWLKEQEKFDNDDSPFKDLDDGLKPQDPTLYIKGFQDTEITESEMKHRLSCGCSWCGVVFSLDDPHQFKDINSLKWYDREHFVCQECYEHSAGDVVKEMIQESVDIYTHDIRTA